MLLPLKTGGSLKLASEETIGKTSFQQAKKRPLINRLHYLLRFQPKKMHPSVRKIRFTSRFFKGDLRFVYAASATILHKLSSVATEWCKK